MPWYAIQHKPAQGERAVENLQAQEACCFYPKITVERVVRGKRTQRLEPLFPGYLFINLEPGDPLWGKLRSTRGVLRVIGFGGKPAVVDDDIIADIRAGLEAVTERGGLKEGQKIEIRNGPFRGVDAIFQAYDGEERAILLISLLNREQKVGVPLSDL